MSGNDAATAEGLVTDASRPGRSRLGGDCPGALVDVDSNLASGEKDVRGVDRSPEGCIVRDCEQEFRDTNAGRPEGFSLRVLL